MNLFRTSAIAAALTLALVATPVSAGTDSDTFVVSITLENDCLITVNDLNFGTVTDLTPVVSGSTTGSVTCTGISALEISFDVGTGGGDYIARTMLNGTDTIAFNLYDDAAAGNVLGDGTGGTATIDFTSTGAAQSFNVFGRTVANQNPKPAGTYASTVTATVSF